MYSSLSAPVLNLETSNAKPREAVEIKGKKANRKQIWKKSSQPWIEPVLFASLSKTAPIRQTHKWKQNQIKSKSIANPLLRHITPRSTNCKDDVKTCPCVQIEKNVKVYITTIKIVTINRSTNWLKVESKIMAIYRIYKPYTMRAFRDRLNDAMSCDSLIIIRIYLKQFSVDMLLLNAVLKLADGRAVLGGSLPKSVPLDFGLEKTFALYFYHQHYYLS